MRRAALLIGLTAIGLSGCSKAPAPRSIDYFDQHPTERADVVTKCKHGNGDHQYEPQAECPTAIESDAKAKRAQDQRAFEQ